MRLRLLESLCLCALASLGCTYSAAYQNMGVHHISGRQLISRDSATATGSAVREGQISWLLLRRVCLTDVGDWIGARDLTVGVTVTHGSAGTQQIGKGVVNATEVRNYNCLQFANRQIIDPFPFRKETYRIALDIVELPAKNAKLLTSLASSVLATASAAPQLAPAAKVGTALFDTFIKPEVESNSSHVHYEQDFEAYELRNNADNPEIPWQNGSFVLLPRAGSYYDVNGNQVKFDLTLANYYVDEAGELRVGNYSSPSPSDAHFADAPYVVMEVASSWRGADTADSLVSESLRKAARAVAATTPAHRDVADKALSTLNDVVNRNYDGITEWTISLLFEANVTMEVAATALASEKPSEERNATLRAALARQASFVAKFGDAGTSKVKLSAQEQEAVGAVTVALNNALAPLIAEAKAREERAARDLALAKSALTDVMKSASSDRDAAVNAALDRVTQAASQKQMWATLAAPVP